MWDRRPKISGAIFLQEQWANVPTLFPTGSGTLPEPWQLPGKSRLLGSPFGRKSIGKNSIWSLARDEDSPLIAMVAMGESLPHNRREFKSRHLRHIQIRDDYIRQRLAERTQAIQAVRHRKNLVTFISQNLFCGFTYCQIVIQYEDAITELCHHLCRYRTAGPVPPRRLDS
jgi:hypothetical protein